MCLVPEGCPALVSTTRRADGITLSLAFRRSIRRTTFDLNQFQAESNSRGVAFMLEASRVGGLRDVLTACEPDARPLEQRGAFRFGQIERDIPHILVLHTVRTYGRLQFVTYHHQRKIDKNFDTKTIDRTLMVFKYFGELFCSNFSSPALCVRLVNSETMQTFRFPPEEAISEVSHRWLH